MRFLFTVEVLEECGITIIEKMKKMEKKERIGRTEEYCLDHSRYFYSAHINCQAFTELASLCIIDAISGGILPNGQAPNGCRPNQNANAVQERVCRKRHCAADDFHNKTAVSDFRLPFYMIHNVS